MRLVQADCAPHNVWVHHYTEKSQQSELSKRPARACMPVSSMRLSMRYLFNQYESVKFRPKNRSLFVVHSILSSFAIIAY